VDDQELSVVRRIIRNLREIVPSENWAGIYAARAGNSEENSQYFPGSLWTRICPS
jgi:hypothetical protein